MQRRAVLGGADVRVRSIFDEDADDFGRSEMGAHMHAHMLNVAGVLLVREANIRGDAITLDEDLCDCWGIPRGCVAESGDALVFPKDGAIKPRGEEPLEMSAGSYAARKTAIVEVIRNCKKDFVGKVEEWHLVPQDGSGGGGMGGRWRRRQRRRISHGVVIAFWRGEMMLRPVLLGRWLRVTRRGSSGRKGGLC